MSYRKNEVKEYILKMNNEVTQENNLNYIYDYFNCCNYDRFNKNIFIPIIKEYYDKSLSEEVIPFHLLAELEGYEEEIKTKIKYIREIELDRRRYFSESEITFKEYYKICKKYIKAHERKNGGYHNFFQYQNGRIADDIVKLLNKKYFKEEN